MMITSLPTLSLDLASSIQRSESYLAKESRQTLELVEERYRKFLFLVSKYPDIALAPSRDIDEVWHAHMLNPRAYSADCIRLFGDLLDHDGGFGMNDFELPNLIDLFDRTAILWEQEFGDSYIPQGSSELEMKKCVKACRVACRRACVKKLLDGDEVS
jgi:hypothetical protein